MFDSMSKDVGGSPRKSFESTRLLLQMRHRFLFDSAFDLIQP
jgi:hypothetical protein